MRSRSLIRSAVAAALAGGMAFAISAADRSGVGIADTADKAKIERAHPSKPGYSPYAGRHFPTMPLFGDTHLHTGFSMDAGAFGARLGPRDAYRFARGEEITSNSGQPVKLSRPLDFLVVADHSDGMGFFPQLMGGDPALLATPQGRKWYDQIRGGKGAEAAMDIIVSFGKGQLPERVSRSRHDGLSQRLDGDHQGGRGLQRARTLHGLHRLRVDVQHRRQQPAPQRGLPRQRRAGLARRTVHDAEAAGKRQPGRPVEVDGRRAGEDGQRAARHRPQRQPEQRAHVPHGRGLRQEDRPRLRAGACPLGAALRGDPDQGHGRGASVPFARTTSSPTSRSGTRAISTAPW